MLVRNVTLMKGTLLCKPKKAHILAILLSLRRSPFINYRIQEDDIEF